MAFAATTVWEVNTGGSDTDNGGGFDPGNSSMINDLACDTDTGNTASPVVSSASYNFVANDVGHWVYVQSGANWTPGWYKIASVASNKATLNAAIGAAVLANGTPSTVVGVGTVATPTGGTWSVDYSQSTAAAIAFTDLVIGDPTTTELTSAANPFGKNHVGNIISVTSGTGFTVQRVQISSVSGTTATVDKAAGTAGSTGGVGGLGGAFASPGQAEAVDVAGNDVYIKAGTYVISVNTNNVALGKLSLGNGVSAVDPNKRIGYQTVRGDNGTKPVLQLSAALGAGIAVVTIAAWARIENIEVDGNSNATSTGFSTTSSSTFYRCKAINCTSRGFLVNASGAYAILCVATENAIGFTGGGFVVGCVARNNTSHGFGNLILIAFCVAADNGGNGIDSLNTGTLVMNCSLYSNTGAGISGASLNNVQIINTIITENTGDAIDSTTNDSATSQALHCALYGNGDVIDGGLREVGIVTLTGDPFTTPASGNFKPNNTAGAGADCRRAGIPGAMPDGLSTGYIDIGAIQIGDTVASGASGGVVVGKRRRVR